VQAKNEVADKDGPFAGSIDLNHVLMSVVKNKKHARLHRQENQT
jgi:hypothetical protein